MTVVEDGIDEVTMSRRALVEGLSITRGVLLVVVEAVVAVIFVEVEVVVAVIFVEVEVVVVVVVVLNDVEDVVVGGVTTPLERVEARSTRDCKKQKQLLVFDMQSLFDNY